MNKLITLKQILEEYLERKEYEFYALIDKPKIKETKNSSFFIDCNLRDKDDTIIAKKWNIEEKDKNNFKHGNILKVKAISNFYRGSFQLIIKSAIEVNDESIKELVFPVAPTSIEKMWEEFKYFLDEIKDNDYKRIVEFVFNNEVIEKFKKTRAGLSNHHDVYGGLLWHTLSILKTAEKIIEIYKELNIDKSLLFTGIIFHDIGKIYEIGDFSEEFYSLHGTLIGHISIASSLIYKAGLDSNIEEEKIYKLQHLILSSHGKLENASPVVPKLIEAVILSQLDDLDSKLNALYKSTKNVKEGSYTSPIRVFNNLKFYIPKNKK